MKEIEGLNPLKVRIVQGTDEATITNGKLDVNATASLSGEAIPISGATTAVGVAIVDGSGNQITSFGGGTQYTEGNTDATITGTAALVEGAANALAVLTQPLTDTQLRATAVPVSGTFWQATQPVSGTVTANLSATDNAVLDAIAASLAGTLTVTGGGGGVEYTEDAAAAADPVGGALIMVRDDALSGQTTTDGDNVAARGTDKGELYVKHTDTIAVTQSGTWDEVGINDSGNSITVDAVNLDIRDLVNTDVVTAELSAVDNAVLDTIAAKDFATQTTLAAMNAKMVTGTDIGDVTINNASGAAAVNIQDGGNVITVDGTVAVTQSGTWDEVGINDSGNVITVDGSGTAGTAASGVVSVQGIASMTPIQVGDNSSSLTVDYATTGSGTATGALRVELPTNGTGVIATVGAVTAITNALPAGTNAIGKLAANSGVDIGDTDVTSVVPGTGATNLGKAEDGAHTSADVGVMALGVRTDVPNAAGAGTTGDYSFVATDMAGGIRTALYETDFAVLGTNHVKKYYTNAGAVTDGIIWSPAAGKRWYVTDIVLQTSAAATITLEDDKAGGDEVVWKGEIAANGGWDHSFQTPLFSGEDAADLMITTSAGNVYVTVTGYEI